MKIISTSGFFSEKFTSSNKLFLTSNATCQKNSSFKQFSFNFSDGFVRNFHYAKLNGVFAKAVLKGCFFLKDNNACSNKTFVSHNAENCESNQTYKGILNDISKANYFKAKHFSFNVDGGRCENCKGEGTVKIEMQFMADVNLTCEICKGKRFKSEVLNVKFEEKNIDDILKMTVDESIAFFTRHNQNRIVKKIQPLKDVGMGYVQLGQSSSTLSGGEAQRIKLATFLLKGTNKNKTLFIFDEPTTGLHFHDIKKLLKSFNSLLDNGHSIIVVEHNIDLIKNADHIIDLGLGGGKNGGQVIFEGSPEQLIKENKSKITPFLREKITI